MKRQILARRPNRCRTGRRTMKTLLKFLGWLAWVATTITLKCVAVVITGAFWLANGGFGEMEGY